MAFNKANLTLMATGNGFQQYRYDTMDAHAAVDTVAYFTDHAVDMLKVGDIIDVIVWATAIRTGTVSTYGRHIVNAVSSTVVDISDVTVGVVTDTD